MKITYENDEIVSIACNAGRIWRDGGVWWVSHYEDGLHLGMVFANGVSHRAIKVMWAFGDELRNQQVACNYFAQALGLTTFDLELAEIDLEDYTRSFEWHTGGEAHPLYAS